MSKHAMDQYKNLTQEELEWADHCFESGNFEQLAKLQEISASRSGRNIRVSPSTILEQHIKRN